MNYKRYIQHMMEIRRLSTLSIEGIDAATDTIGRSYKKGKQLADVIAEFEAGAGTQYADWIIPLLQDPDVTEDINWLLSKGREILYRETYRLLRSVHEQAISEEQRRQLH